MQYTYFTIEITIKKRELEFQNEISITLDLKRTLLSTKKKKEHVLIIILHSNPLVY